MKSVPFAPPEPAIYRETVRRALAEDLGWGDATTEGTVGAGAVALDADAVEEVENDGDGEAVVAAGDLQQRPPRLRLHVGGVDHGEAAGGQPLFGQEVEDLEGVRRRALVVFVVRHQAAEDVGREHLGRLEEAPGEGRLARAGGSDQDHQGQLGDADPRDGAPVTQG